MADDLIMRVGESVFGLSWESDMALALDVSEDDLKRWASGAEPPKPGLFDELAVFVADRQDELQGLAAELERVRERPRSGLVPSKKNPGR